VIAEPKGSAYEALSIFSINLAIVDPPAGRCLDELEAGRYDGFASGG
jgi:hypothetical protein